MYARIAQLYRRYIALCSRRAWLVLVVVLALSGAMLWLGTGIKVRGDLEDLFPEDTPAVVLAREARKTLGSTQELRILVGGGDRELNRAVAGEIAAWLGTRDDIARVEFQRDIDFFEKNGLLFIPIDDLKEMQDEVSAAIQEAVKKDLGLDDFELDEEEKPAPDAPKKEKKRLPTIEEVKRDYKVEGFTEYFESPDGGVIAVKGFPKFKPSDATKTGALNDAIEAELGRLRAEHPGKDLSFTMDGDYSQVTKAARQIISDATVSGAWAFVFIALIMIVYFRRFRSVIVTAAVLFVTTGWTLGFAFVAIGYLNLVTSISFTILFGMSVDYIVHGMARVDHEFRQGVTLEEALATGLIGLGRPVFNAMLTTAVTFWALVFFDFRGFSQLGIIAGFGVVFALLAFYLVFPPLAIVMHRLWAVKPKAPLVAPEHEGHEAGHSPPVTRGHKKLAWGLIALLVAAAGGSTVLAKDLYFDPDMGKFRVQDTAAENELKTKYREAETRTASPALIITQDLAQTERLYRYLQDNLERFPVLKEVSSVFAFVPDQQADKLPIIAETRRKVVNKYGALEGEDKADADRLMPYLEPKPFQADDLPAWVKEKFTDTSGRFGRYVLLYAKGSKANALEAQKIQDEIGRIELPADGDRPAETFFASATYFVSAEAYRVVKSEGPMAALIGLLVVMAVVLFDFRRPRELVMITVPILSSFAIMLGICVLSDFPLDLFNVIVLPQIFGIGIDTGTHLTHRIKEGGPHVVEHVRHTAVAAGISSLLTTIGFLALVFVQNKGLQSIGWLAVLGIATAYVVNIIMFTGFMWLTRPAARVAAGPS